MGWASTPTSCRDAADAGWATAPASCRDPVFYVEEGYVEGGYVEEGMLGGWADQPMACRDMALGGQLYGGLGGLELDALAGSGTTTSASGWTTTILEACRDGD